MNEQQLMVQLKALQNDPDATPEQIAAVETALDNLLSGGPVDNHPVQGRKLNDFIKFSRVLKLRGLELCKDLVMGDDDDIYLRDGTNMMSLVEDVQFVYDTDAGEHLLEITRPNGVKTTRPVQGINELIGHIEEPADGKVRSIAELAREISELQKLFGDVYTGAGGTSGWEGARIEDVEQLESSFKQYALDFATALADIESDLRETMSARDMYIVQQAEHGIRDIEYCQVARTSKGRGVATINFSQLAGYGDVKIVMHFDSFLKKQHPADLLDISNWIVRTSVLASSNSKRNDLVWSRAHIEDNKLYVHLKSEHCSEVFDGEKVVIEAVYTGADTLSSPAKAIDTSLLPDFNCDGTPLRPLANESFDADDSAQDQAIDRVVPTEPCCKEDMGEEFVFFSSEIAAVKQELDNLTAIIAATPAGSFWLAERTDLQGKLQSQLDEMLQMITGMACDCPDLLSDLNSLRAEYGLAPLTQEEAQELCAQMADEAGEPVDNGPIGWDGLSEIMLDLGGALGGTPMPVVVQVGSSTTNEVYYMSGDTYGDTWDSLQIQVVHSNSDGVQQADPVLVDAPPEGQTQSIGQLFEEIHEGDIIEFTLVGSTSYPNEVYLIISGNVVAPTEVLGCPDPAASNYNPEATTDDGSCIYGTVDGEGGSDAMIAEMVSWETDGGDFGVETITFTLASGDANELNDVIQANSGALISGHGSSQPSNSGFWANGGDFSIVDGKLTLNYNSANYGGEPFALSAAQENPLVDFWSQGAS